MARELAIDVVMRTTEAETALVRLETEFLKAGNTIEEASKKVEKFEKSYRDNAAKAEAKRALDGIARSTQEVGAAADKTTPKLTAQERATDALRATVLRYASAAVVGTAIKSTLDWAGNLTDLSKATGISVTSLQKFETIGKSNGQTMQTMADMALQMSNRLAGNDKSASAALDKMGLGAQRLLALKPDEMMLEFARALQRVENPQQRVALAMDVLGRSGKNLLPVLADLNAKWDSTNAKLGEDAVEKLDEAGDKIDELTSAGKGLIANFLAPFAPLLTGIAAALGPVASLFSAFMRDVLSPLDLNKWREWKDNLVDAARAMQYISGVGPGIMAGPPPPPDTPRSPWLQTQSGLGGTAPVPGTPEFSRLERILGRPIGSGGSTPMGLPGVTPYTANQWAVIQQVLGPQNPLGMGGLGRFPGFAPPPVLPSGGSPLSFLNGMQLPGTVPMNAPGVGGGGFGQFMGQHGTQIAGLGLQLASRFINPNSRAGGALSGAMQGAGMGAMFGPWGMAVGGGLGLLGGLFSRRPNEQNQVNQMRSGADFDALIAKARELGVSTDAVFNARKVKDYEKAIEQLTRRINETETESNKVKTAMERWGLTIEDMGPKFQQMEMNKAILQTADDFVTLVNAGADVNKMLERMAPTLSEFLQKSKLMGTDVPREMKPMLEAAQKAGLLFDENGQKLSDEAFASIKWAETMTQGFDRVVASIERLIASISDVGDEFDRATGAANGFGDAAGRAGDGWWNGGGSSGETPGFATGGVAGRDFRRPGHGDIFPAMLKRGERVLPPGASDGGTNVTINGLSVGSFDSRGDAVDQIGESVVRYLERRGARLVA